MRDATALARTGPSGSGKGAPCCAPRSCCLPRPSWPCPSPPPGSPTRSGARVAEQSAPPVLGDGGPGADAKAAPGGVRRSSSPPRHRPRRPRRYTVSQERFDAQLRALRDAGYRTVSTREFDRTPAGRPHSRPGAPSTSPSTTARTDQWTHADPVLARYGMKAAAYLITGRVGTHRPPTSPGPRSGGWRGRGAGTSGPAPPQPRTRAVDAAGTSGRCSPTGDGWRTKGASRPPTSTGEGSRRTWTERSTTSCGRPAPPRPFAYPFSERLDEVQPGRARRRGPAVHAAGALHGHAHQQRGRPLPAGPRARPPDR